MYCIKQYYFSFIGYTEYHYRLLEVFKLSESEFYLLSSSCVFKKCCVFKKILEIFTS